MKKIVLCILSICLLLPLVSCAKRDESLPEGFLLCQPEGGEFDFYYPQTWILDRQDAGFVSAYVSDLDFSNVSVTGFTPKMEEGAFTTLETYVKDYYFKQFETNFNNLEVEKGKDGNIAVKIMTVDSCEAVKVSYSARFGEEDYRFSTVLISNGGVIYSLTYTAKKDLFEQHTQEFEQMVGYFRFR